MKNIENVINEILEISKSKIEPKRLDERATIFLLVGYSSINNLTEKANLDIILNSDNVKDSLNEALKSIGEKFKEIKEPLLNLKNLNLSSEEISQILVTLKSSFTTSQQYRYGFEYMLKRVDESLGRNRVEKTTPNCLNKLAVEILEPKDGEFYDGTFGIGDSAIESYNFASQHGNKLTIYGQEINQKIYSIACIRMFIHGINPINIEYGDVLLNPKFKEDEKSLKKFDYIIMQPPFSITWKDKENEILNDKYSRFIYGTPRASSADWLFISSALKSLNETGKGIIITTLGSLFRSGSEKSLRKKLIGFDYIETVIELTGGLFTTTTIPCAMIVFNMNKKEEMRNKIQFINADEVYEVVKKGNKILDEENIKSILEVYRNKKNIEGLSTLVDLKDIVDANLSPSKYVIKSEFESSKYGKIKIHLNKLKASKTLGDIGDFYRGINVTSKNVQDPNGNYKIINFADIKNGEIDIDSISTYKIENNARVEAYKVEAGDVIISNKGVTKICVIPEHEGNILISQNFAGIRLNSNYNPEYIKEFLESPIGEYLIESRKTGTSVSMINIKDLKEVPLVDMDFEKQNEIISNYVHEEMELKREIEILLSKMDNLKLDLYNKMNLKDSFDVM